MTQNLLTAAKNLAARGFKVQTFDTAAQATAWLLREIAQDAVVAHGGSVTLAQLGVAEKLRERGNLVLSNAGLGKACGLWARKQSMFADVYLTSANAVTLRGEVQNIDGSGNRVAATLYGPDTVYFCVGKNKLVADESAGMRRIKEVACPQNAKRLGLDTPCARTGKCADCNAPQRICAVYARLDRPMIGKTHCVLLIDEELGY